MAILTNSGRVAWDTTPVPESIDSTALLAEIGRRKATCTPDEAGEIIVPTGRFTESLVPTKHLYMRFGFDFTDAPNATIRELAVFVPIRPSS